MINLGVSWSVYLLAGNAETSKGVDVIVADKYIGNATLTLARKQQIPVVTSEWIVQCLIAGRRLSVDSHPRYLLSTDK